MWEPGENESTGENAPAQQNCETWNDIFTRLVETQNEAVNDPNFAESLQAHFNRLPARYAMDVNIERAEDVLIHQKLLKLAVEPENRPVFDVRFSGHIVVRSDGNEEQLELVTDVASSSLKEDHPPGPEPSLKFEDLVLEAGKNVLDLGDSRRVQNSSFESQVHEGIPIHEITFSTIDKPKLLSQDSNSLYEALEDAVAKTERDAWSKSSKPSSPIERLRNDDSEVDRRLLKMEKKVASGSCGDLYRGTYLGQDVAIKVLKPERLNKDLEYEFSQEVMILRKVKHDNVVRFIGACTRLPHLCIVTEFMSGGSLYDYLHRQEGTLMLPTLVKYAIDVSKGMEYLHENEIIHRDLKAANLLMDMNYVVKVADFGVARFLTQSGQMTAETGTYRWMAPEVINHQPYDQKADVFSFAIVLWELLTAKLPYDSMTPLQAALGVRQGLRPPIPENTHPIVANVLKRCWEEDPTKRPSFSEITVMLEEILAEVATE